MRLEALESRSDGFSPLHRLDGRFKLLFALFYVIAVIATPAGWWRTLGVLALLLVFLAGLCGISPRWLLLRWLGFLALVGMLAAVAAPRSRGPFRGGPADGGALHPGQEQPCLRDDADPGRGHLVARSAAGDARLGAPRVLVATLQLMERYIHVLGEELDRMRTARRARSFHPRSDWSWTLLTSMVSVLWSVRWSLRTGPRGMIAEAGTARCAAWRMSHREDCSMPARTLKNPFRLVVCPSRPQCE